MPWTWLVRRAARAGGFLDPVGVLDRLRRFSQPSEVMEPVELLRAGLVFHARGLVNSRAIQHNLDWVWPYWAERQFDPADESFLPRAFSATHVNLTHRNWTAFGLPDGPETPLADPRGLLTPLTDGWSLDAWVLSDDGRALFPSRLPSVVQTLEADGNLAVATECREDGLSVTSRAEATPAREGPSCRWRLRALADGPGWLAVALRPANPEGVSFIHDVERLEDPGWRVNGRDAVFFGAAPDRWSFSRYAEGDVRFRLPEADARRSIRCDVGMATAAALFRLEPGKEREVVLSAPLRVQAPGAEKRGRPIPAAQRADDDAGAPRAHRSAEDRWAEAMEGAAVLDVPDRRFVFLYQAALRTLVLLSPGEVYPGPYTYKRFWFRDAAFMLDALLCAGLGRRAAPCLEGFFPRQERDGYFLSQEGEWDANGQALRTLDRFHRLTGVPPPAAWRRAVERGADWIVNKRLKAGPHAGLLPAGFSAEHFGPNDYYYWDDFWGVAGLEAAANLLEAWGDGRGAARRRKEAAGFLAAIEESLHRAEERLGRDAGHRGALPAAPDRRLDAGAVGSLAASYPLQVFPAGDPRVARTADFLLERCFLRGGFFQDIVHAGINPYLTLHVAQVLLRAGDRRSFDLVAAVADLASPTGQWPEAVHPRTGGGCMGDGQHGWASAEWVMMMRNMFVREEEKEGALVLASGVPASWLAAGRAVSFGPAPTLFGPVTVTVRREGGGTVVSWRAAWRGAPPRVEARLPGRAAVAAAPGRSVVVVEEGGRAP